MFPLSCVVLPCVSISLLQCTDIVINESYHMITKFIYLRLISEQASKFNQRNKETIKLYNKFAIARMRVVTFLYR